MLVIRLSRTGRKKQPYYRVVVAEKSAPIKGRLIEVLGHFNPRTKELEIDVERAKERVKNGAQPSETAEALLEKAGVLKRGAITEQNRRPERKSKKAMKAEAESDGSPQSSDVKSDDSQQTSDISKKDDSAKADEKPGAKTDDSDKSDAAKDDSKPEGKKEEPSSAKASEDKKAEPKAETKTKDKAAAKADEKPEAKAEKTDD